MICMNLLPSVKQSENQFCILFLRLYSYSVFWTETEQLFQLYVGIKMNLQNKEELLDSIWKTRIQNSIPLNSRLN